MKSNPNLCQSTLPKIRGVHGLVAAEEPSIRHPFAGLADWKKSIHIRPPD